MRGRTFFLFGMAVGLLALPLTCNRTDRVKCGYNLVPVVVVTSDLKAGTVLTFDHLSVRSVPGQFVTSSIVKPDSASYVINQRLVNDLQAGDPVRWSDFAQARAAVKPKTRVVSIDVDPSRALSGELFAKDHIDVLMTATDPQTNVRVAQTLLQNVIVLGVLDRPAPEPTAIRLLVTPEEAEQLLLAQELGKFSLSLRSRDDLDVYETHKRTTLAEILKGRDDVIRCNYRPIQLIRGTTTK